MGDKLTRSDVEKIQAELDERKGPIMDKALEDVKVARAQGDLSENFEYKAAKQFLNRNKGRIRYLEKVLKFATIIDDSSNPGEVGINNVVTLYFPVQDKERTCKIVTEIRGDVLNDYISIESPIGKAVLGHCVGETVNVKVSEDKTFPVEIRALVENTDDSNDALRSF